MLLFVDAVLIPLSFLTDRRMLVALLGKTRVYLTKLEKVRKSPIEAADESA
jgi:hypothetical protein